MVGAFVVFEGGDGAGKSTQARLLCERLRARGREVVLTREPGGTPVGEAVREVLLGAGSHGMTARTEALLFAAARAEHVGALIRPALARGAVVVSDRYADSSIAYQGAGRGLGEQAVAELNAWATEALVPDLTVLLDVSPGMGLGRAAEANRMEAEPPAFHRSVREALLRRAGADPQRYLVVDAGGSVEQVAGLVLSSVIARLAALDRAVASDGPGTVAPVGADGGQPAGGGVPVGSGHGESR